MFVNRKAIHALADLRVWLDTLEDIEELITAVIEEDGFTREEVIGMYENPGEDKVRTAAFTFANNVIDYDVHAMMLLLPMISKDFHA